MKDTVTSDPNLPLRLPLQPRYNSLDIWRGMACLMVVLAHATFYIKYDLLPARDLQNPLTKLLWFALSRMSLGVQIFFVISGYCIAATVDSTRRGNRPRWDYFRRRLRRILPPYWAALLLTIVLALIVARSPWPRLLDTDPVFDTGHIPHPAVLDSSQWLGNLTLTEHWRAHLFGSDELKLLGPSWTLCYEEQFYVVCGLVLLFAPRRFFRGIALVSLLTLITMACMFLIPGASFNGFFFDGRWLLFAGGVAVYHHLNYGIGERSWKVPLLLAFCFAASVLFRYGWLDSESDPDLKARSFEFIVGGAFALSILGLRPLDGRLMGSLLLKPIGFCGTMCYSLYLVHWPVVKVLAASAFTMGIRGLWPTLLITVPVCILASVIVAWMFHRLIERHFINSASAKAASVRRRTVHSEAKELAPDQSMSEAAASVA